MEERGAEKEKNKKEIKRNSKIAGQADGGETE